MTFPPSLCKAEEDQDRDASSSDHDSQFVFCCHVHNDFTQHIFQSSLCFLEGTESKVLIQFIYFIFVSGATVASLKLMMTRTTRSQIIIEAELLEMVLNIVTLSKLLPKTIKVAYVSLTVEKAA